MITPIAFLPPAGAEAVAGAAAPPAPSGDFAAWFDGQLGQVNQQLIAADRGIVQLAAGDASNLHQVMINLEQAKLSMALVMQVRNHLLDAYKEVIQMQV